MPPRNPQKFRKRSSTQPIKLRLGPVELAKLLRRRKAGGLAVALSLIVLVALLDRWVGLFPVDDDWHRYHNQTFEVLRVVDGDTLDLRVADGENATTRIRLWGVDTPEMSNRNNDGPPEPWAQEATDFTRQAVEGQQVTVYLQDHRLRGRYGRLLAYIQMPDGRVLNAALIEQGLSKHDRRWGHDRVDEYDELELFARKNRHGLWGQ